MFLVAIELQDPICSFCNEEEHIQHFTLYYTEGINSFYYIPFLQQGTFPSIQYCYTIYQSVLIMPVLYGDADIQFMCRCFIGIWISQSLAVNLVTFVDSW